MSVRLGFEHVTLRYGAQAVLTDYSLELMPGAANCLMGPSGSGKTSLLRLLMGLARPEAGRVHSFGPQAVVFQEDRLLPHLDAPGNLRLVVGRGRDMELRQMLADLGLEAEGYKRVRDFSGGMQRRVAIARALLTPFELLLLDEPFKGLDEESRSRAAEVILDAARGKTLVLVTHDPAEANLLKARVHRLP